MLYCPTNSLKTAGLLETCSNFEVPSVIRFFCGGWRGRNGGDLSQFGRSLRNTCTVLEIAVDRVKALDKGKTGVNKQRPGLRSTSTKDGNADHLHGRLSPENALITAERQAHFAESARQRGVLLGSVHSTVHNYPEQRCVCACRLVFKELHGRLRSSFNGSLFLSLSFTYT